MSASNSNQHNLLSIFIIVLAVSLVLAAVFGGYAFANHPSQPATISVQVEDPITIVQYPVSLDLFPGDLLHFNVTVYNIAENNYTIALDFRLNDSFYQNNYVTFSNTLYNVVPGDQNLTALISVSANAPAANLTLTITCNRNPQSAPTPIQNTAITPDAGNNSIELLQAGLKWASPNGTSALYVDWKDCWLAHDQTDGANWGPWQSVADMGSWRNTITQILQNNGVKNITYAGDMPQNLTGYNLIILEACFGINPQDAAAIRTFVANGGGVVMIDGTPCYLSVYCKDWWPGRLGGTDLTSIADWFGYYTYQNVGGAAYPCLDNPLGTSLLKSSQLFYTSGVAADSVTAPIGNSVQVIAQYQGTGTGSSFEFPFEPVVNAPFAFTHNFGAGRVYWQADFWPYLESNS